MKLDCWKIVMRWHPQEMNFTVQNARRCLHGIVYGHPRAADGAEVTTSPIEGRRGNAVVTLNGGEYELGRPFPGEPEDAAEKLLGELKELAGSKA